MNRVPRIAGTTAAVLIALAGLAAAAPESAESIYTRALTRERQLRDAESGATLAQLRGTVQIYETLVRRYPTSGYSDNALWQAGNLAILAFDRFADATDRRTAIRLLTHLRTQYPYSPLVGRAAQLLRQVEADRVEPEP